MKQNGYNVFLLAGSLLQIAGTVEAADTSYMTTVIRNYFSQPRHYIDGAEYKDMAKEYILEEFRRFGLQTDLQHFEKYISGSYVNGTNIFGVLKGDNFGQKTDRILGISAHYDTLPETPGVDDNGSGVAALLEVARWLADNRATWRRNNTIVFLVFDANELGLCGSQQYISTYIIPWLVKNYGANARSLVPHGVIVLDSIMFYNSTTMSQLYSADFEQKFGQIFNSTIENIKFGGYKGDFIALVYREPSRDKDLAGTFSDQWQLATAKNQVRMRYKVQPLPLPLFNITFLMPATYSDFLQSDHFYLWKDQIPAIYLTDTGHYRSSMDQCYHRACDDVKHVLTDDNIAFLSMTTDVVINTIHVLSEPTRVKTESAAALARIDVALATLCLLRIVGNVLYP